MRRRTVPSIHLQMLSAVHQTGMLAVIRDYGRALEYAAPDSRISIPWKVRTLSNMFMSKMSRDQADFQAKHGSFHPLLQFLVLRRKRISRHAAGFRLAAAPQQ